MRVESPPLDECRLQVRRVLESEAFRNSEGLRRLLSYVAERSLNHTVDELKEYVIGLEVFGKPPSYDPQKDASVRVQISRLRQKLQEYFNAEGEADPYRLVLPKGHFTILFQPRDSDPPTVARSDAPDARKTGNSPAEVALRAAAVLLAIFIVWTFSLWRKVDTLESRVAPGKTANDFDLVWSAFLKPEIPCEVVFGSPPFFASASRNLFLRMYRTTNPENPRSSAGFSNLDSTLGPLDGPRYDYASMGDAIGIQRLTAFLASRGVKLRAVPAHLAVWENIQDSNLIFVGAARMNPLLRRLPIRQDFELEADDYIHNRNPQPGEQVVYETTSHRDGLSYAVVSSYPGLKPGREILLVSAHSTPGAVGAVDFITSVEGMRVIREKLKPKTGEHQRFQVLLRVFTDQDSPVKTEYVTHHLTQ